MHKVIMNVNGARACYVVIVMCLWWEQCMLVIFHLNHIMFWKLR